MSTHAHFGPTLALTLTLKPHHERLAMPDLMRLFAYTLTCVAVRIPSSHTDNATIDTNAITNTFLTLSKTTDYGLRAYAYIYYPGNTDPVQNNTTTIYV